jgi:thiamine-phosphate pyrophosphorylase
VALGSVEALWRTARTLRPARARGKTLPRLLFFTDPARVLDPAAAIRRLPRGAGVVYRAFGRADALARGRELLRHARRRGLVFLVGADPGLAARLMADGVHLPQASAASAAGLRRSRPDWLVTCAAHSAGAIVRARLAGADAVALSPVFESRSPSAGGPLGLLRFAELVRVARMPVYALGGVNRRTGRRLIGIGAAGLAAVEALTDEAAPSR